jgi:hypothetical protein
MEKLIKFAFILILLFGICIILPVRIYAQSNLTKLSGPRIGLTAIGGKMAETLKDKYDAFPLVTQFGWQFEWRYFSVENGPTGVVEFVPLIGGVEQGLILPSLSLLIGMRSRKGVEFGIGPNISVSGASIVIAAGITKKTGNINWPINLSLLPSEKGLRVSLLVGFNIAE